ncbi:MAG: magnesium chelatase [Sphingobacteriales bacterium 50-39]|nr:YifB family Mg chelatase-like AAA ATPase [Sphingobacteriales bacterium]OJW59014.1 MAG: magnesium chelatase [Sphingobacteriales bacterium 50-39]
MLVKTFGSAVYGVEAITIIVEVNVTEGLHTFIVGLPDNAVKESVQRVESAIKTNGFYMPRTKLIVNLAPAGIRKSGAAFDLPIALGVLAATDQIPGAAQLKDYLIMGELGLDGSIHPIKGALPIAIQARKDGFKGLILPRQNAKEAAIVNGLPVFSFSHIREVIEFFREGCSGPPMDANGNAGTAPIPEELDFTDVRGQEYIKRALEIAAAGGHNTLLIGAPGAGKTMLARRLPTILPPLSVQEALETTKIHSVAGRLPEHSALISSRPFRSPHHTISGNALVGGGSIPQPGEISLAHNGVLFLDELPEFSRSVLEVMRQPMEDGKVTVSRAKMSVEFPANFMLLAAMNPCPCGYYNHPDKECNCLPGAVQKYLNKISGPLLDRIDLHVEVVPVPYAHLSATTASESSSAIRAQVIAAREKQRRRYKKTLTNAQLTTKMTREFCRIDPVGEKLLRDAMNRLHLSARAYDRILKVSRTIADLAGEEYIKPGHLAEAIQYRCLDRDSWGQV